MVSSQQEEASSQQEDYLLSATGEVIGGCGTEERREEDVAGPKGSDVNNNITENSTGNNNYVNNNIKRSRSWASSIARQFSLLRPQSTIIPPPTRNTMSLCDLVNAREVLGDHQSSQEQVVDEGAAVFWSLLQSQGLLMAKAKGSVGITVLTLVSELLLFSFLLLFLAIEILNAQPHSLLAFLIFGFSLAMSVIGVLLIFYMAKVGDAWEQIIVALRHRSGYFAEAEVRLGSRMILASGTAKAKTTREEEEEEEVDFQTRPGTLLLKKRDSGGDDFVAGNARSLAGIGHCREILNFFSDPHISRAHCWSLGVVSLTSPRAIMALSVYFYLYIYLPVSMGRNQSSRVSETLSN